MNARRYEVDAYGWRTDPDLLDVEGDYRYLLPRVRDDGDGSHLMVVGLNPSEAGAIDDPHKPDTTVQVVEQWAGRVGPKFGALPVVHSYSRITFVNLFAWRHASPAELDLVIAPNSTVDAVGIRNLDVVQAVLDSKPETVVVGWGDAKEVKRYQAAVTEQRRAIEEMMANAVVQHVGTLTKGKEPRHGMTWRFVHCDGLLRQYTRHRLTESRD